MTIDESKRVPGSLRSPTFAHSYNLIKNKWFKIAIWSSIHPIITHQTSEPAIFSKINVWAGEESSSSRTGKLTFTICKSITSYCHLQILFTVGCQCVCHRIIYITKIKFTLTTIRMWIHFPGERIKTCISADEYLCRYTATDIKLTRSSGWALHCFPLVFSTSLACSHNV